MKLNQLIVIMLCLIIFCSFNVKAEPELNHIHYSLSGGDTDIESIKLIANYQFDQTNGSDLHLSYGDNDLKLEGYWVLNFYNENNSKLNLELGLANCINGNKFGKAIGFSYEGVYLNQNNYFLNCKYFIEKDSKLILNGGLSVPLVPSTRLTLGMGNSYWSQSKYLFNLGIKVDL